MPARRRVLGWGSVARGRVSVPLVLQAADSGHSPRAWLSPCSSRCLAFCTVLVWPKSGSGLEILECRRSLGENVIGQTDFADCSRHCNGPDQRAEY